MEGSGLRWRGVVAGGGEVGNLRWRELVSGGEERSQVEGSGLR